MSQFQVSKLVLVIYCYYDKSTKTYWLGTIIIDFIVAAHQEFGSSLAGRFWLRSLKRFQSGINWSCSHGGSIQVPLHVDLSVGLLKYFPRSEQSKKKGNCVKEFADIFFESQLSTCGFPDIPMTFSILSSWKGKCLWDLVGVEGQVLWPHITSTLIPLASAESMATANWKGTWGIKSSYVPEMKRKQIWLNRENVKSSTIVGSTERKHVWCVCFHSISNCYSLWSLLDFSVFL